MPEQPAIEARYAMSPMQQGMFFNGLFAPNAGVDIEQMIWDLNEDLDIDAFQRAWNTAVRRHAVLRTRFDWEQQHEPFQEVLHSVEMPFEVVDLSGEPAETQQRRLTEFLKTDRRQGFDFSRAPLMRLTLFRLGPKHDNLIWTFSHAILDGRSFTLLIQEVFDAYEAYREGSEPTPPRTTSYRTYIDWLQARDWSDARAFWKTRLAGFTTPTTLPIDGGPSNGIEHGHGRHERWLSEQLTESLAAFAEKTNVTINTLVQAAWALLLGRYSEETDVVFGATRAGRHATVEAAETIVGVCINTLPVRVNVEEDQTVRELLHQLRTAWIEMRPHEHLPLVEIQAGSDAPGNTALFDSILVFENYTLNDFLRSAGGPWERRRFELWEQTNYPLNLYGYAGRRLHLRLEYHAGRFDENAAGQMLAHLETLLAGLATDPDRRLADVPMLTPDETRRVLDAWNDTAATYPAHACVHTLFETQAAQTPDAVAVIHDQDSLTYAALNARANQLAHRLQRDGVRTETLVGICTDRSTDMAVAMLAVLKAGGAYVPLDPEFPRERLAFMVEDAHIPIVITRTAQKHLVDGFNAAVLCLDDVRSEIAQEPDRNLQIDVSPSKLCYVIYTSGSTGRPKGVMVEHRNVVNFFAGMDACIEHDPPGAWLAVTSLSFDISVLELLWTLTRGFHVVLYDPDLDRSSETRATTHTEKSIDFSLFYFASDEGGEQATDKYRLLLEGARFADEHGFAAVWTPERHFHAFGGLYPNPSVAGAAVAAVTKRVGIRAGSCVSPLHTPIRIAEEWSVVDNLSAGRVGVSFAAGWQPNDFAIMPENFEDRKSLMFRQIEDVQALWRGETRAYPNGKGIPVEIRTLPRPIQRELPVWITAAGSPDTFRMAGEKGYNLLTHLLGQSVEELGEKIAIYRNARREHGHDPAAGTVTVMLHCFVGESDDAVREHVRQPMKDYLRSSVGLVKLAAEVPIFKQKMTGDAVSQTLDHFSDDELEEVLDFSFERYFETSGLFGSVDTCLRMVDRMKGIDADEIACLIDFGGDVDAVIDQFPLLDDVRRRASTSVNARNVDPSIAGLIRRHDITHLQCTPSMASLLAEDPATLQALGSLDCLMIGGEAFPPALAALLKEHVRGRILNMYGPTETTIWSATHPVGGESGAVPIGRPIANTELYILDRRMRPTPAGVPGELLIGGDGVTRGYLNRPALTDERFVADPFKPGGRLYRTGDRARYRPDGCVEFLGRFDHQIKLRGYRIELGEIEALLEEMEAVRAAVAIVREDTPGDQRLAAYVVPEDRSRLDIDVLKSRLRERLPDYMVPTHIVVLDAFPLTPNKKIDRKALPVPEAAAGRAPATYVSPNGAFEKDIAQIWQAVLNVQRVGADDNFFELGGHSLLAVQVHRRVRTLAPKDIAITDLFRFPTVRSLAGFLSDGGAQENRVAQSQERASTRKEAMQRRKMRRKPSHG